MLDEARESLGTPAHPLHHSLCRSHVQGKPENLGRSLENLASYTHQYIMCVYVDMLLSLIPRLSRNAICTHMESLVYIFSYMIMM